MNKLFDKLPFPTAKLSIFSVLMLLITSIIIIFSLISGWNTLNSLKQVAVEERIAALQNLADKVTAITSEEFIEAGLKGAAIGEAMDKKRLECIADYKAAQLRLKTSSDEQDNA